MPTAAKLAAEFSDRECKQIMSRNGLPSTPYCSIENRYVELSKTGKIEALLAAYDKLVRPDTSPNPRAKQIKHDAMEVLAEAPVSKQEAAAPIRPASAQPRRVTVLVNRRDKPSKMQAVDPTQPQPEATRSGRIRRAKGIFDNSSSLLPPQSETEAKLTKNISRGTLVVQKNWLTQSSKDTASIVTRYEERQALAPQPSLPQGKLSWLAPRYGPCVWQVLAEPVEAKMDELYGPCKHGIRKTRCKECGGAYFNAGSADNNDLLDDDYPQWHAGMRRQWQQIRAQRPSRKRRALLEAKCKRKKCPGCDDCRRKPSILTKLAAKHASDPDADSTKVGSKKRRALTREQTTVATKIIRPYWDLQTGKSTWDSDGDTAEDLVQLVNDQLRADDLPANYTLQNLRSWKKNAHYKWTCTQNQRIPPSWNAKGATMHRFSGVPDTPSDESSDWSDGSPPEHAPPLPRARPKGKAASRAKSSGKRPPSGNNAKGNTPPGQPSLSTDCAACKGMQRAHTCLPWARCAPWDEKLVQDSPRKRQRAAPKSKKDGKASTGGDGAPPQQQRKRVRQSSSWKALAEPKLSELVRIVDHTGATTYRVVARKQMTAGAAKHAAHKYVAVTEANCLSEKTVPRKLTPPIRKPRATGSREPKFGPDGKPPPAIRCKCRKSKCLKMSVYAHRASHLPFA